jgi:plasmid stability protein
MTPEGTPDMADVKIRKIPEWVVLHYQARAKRAGRSMEDELRELLTEDARRAQREFAEEADRLRRALFERHGLFSDSAELIREERERRG